MNLQTDTGEEFLKREPKIDLHIKDSEQLLRTVVEKSPLPIGVYIGKELRILFANQSIINFWGKGDDVIGKCLAEVLPELHIQGILTQCDDVFATGIEFSATNQHVELLVEGIKKEFFFNYNLTPLRKSSGEIYGVMSTAADVTEFQLANKKILKSEQNLRNIILQAPVAMCLFREPNHILEIANKRMYEIMGKTEKEILGKPIFEGLHEAKDQGFEELLNGVYNTGKTYQANAVPVNLPRLNGIETIYVNFVYEAYTNPDGKISGVMAVAVDVTEQVLSKKEVEESSEKFHTLADNIPNLAWMANPDGYVFWYNKRWYEYTGTSPKEMEGWGWQSVHDPGVLPTVLDKWKNSIEHGEAFEMTFPIKGADGIFRSFLTRIIPVKNAEGNTIRWFGSNTDITKQIALENQKDNFIAMASHELRTPVTVLKTYTQILQKKLEDDGQLESAEHFSKMDAQINKLTGLVERMLDVTKMQTGTLQFQRTTFNFNDLIKETTDQLQITTRRHNIELHLHEHVTLHADRDRIGQVITNFITNAIKYSPNAVRVIVETTINDGNVLFSVKDFGIGIKKENHTKVFEQFFRVNNNDQNTFPGVGLGLYISSEIIKGEGGKLWVQSLPGEGSKFYFTLPINQLEKVL